MNILVLFAVLSAGLAEKFPSQSSYSFLHPSNHFAIRSDPFKVRSNPFKVRSNPFETRSRPITHSTYSTPTSTFIAPRPTFSTPQHTFPPSPRAAFSAPRTTYSSPQSIFTTPKPTYSSPQPTYSAPHKRFVAKPVVPILRDDRVHPEDGAYSFSVETGDGVKRQESGTPVYTKDGPITAIKGSYSFTLPDGQVFELHYIADENGFQPQSSFIPVAPAFPHPIPAHALEQIERGKREHAARARGELLRQRPSQSYRVPSRPRRPSSTYGVPY